MSITFQAHDSAERFSSWMNGGSTLSSLFRIVINLIHVCLPRLTPPRVLQCQKFSCRQDYGHNRLLQPLYQTGECTCC